MPHVSHYGFEPPRSMEVFGVGSWNSLCLAQNVNLLQETKGEYNNFVTLSASNQFNHSRCP